MQAEPWQILLHWLAVLEPYLVGLLSLLGALHALLYKRDPRSALGWIAVCLFLPLFGPLLYYVLGVNRVRTRAIELIGERPVRKVLGHESSSEMRPTAAALTHMPDPRFAGFVRATDSVTHKPLLAGNAVRPLFNGEEAFPAMLQAIQGARKRIFLSTYIFETNHTGDEFVKTLVAAHKRGVEVRVMVDGVGEHYSFPRIGRRLKKAGVPFARFIPPRVLPPTVNLNLRNHRKVLVVDGVMGFTGGMNIGDRHLVNLGGKHRVADTHFLFQGPVVEQLEKAFLDDWWFVTKKQLDPLPWSGNEVGTAYCRTITDGPNEDLDKLITVLVNAINMAKQRVCIIVPYFLPQRELMMALQSAALRGVDVDVILPEKNNLIYVHWAMHNIMWELLQFGVNLWFQPPPFDHTKLVIIDHDYLLVGSANLDPRSLRLNFELMVEIVDPELGRHMMTNFERTKLTSRAITLAEVEGRPLWVRARDAFCWLFSPYL